jgi:predicted alpha/beta-fold hydrolase
MGYSLNEVYFVGFNFGDDALTNWLFRKKTRATLKRAV